LGDPAPELGDASPELGDPAPELGDASPELGDPAPELGDASPEPGDASPKPGDPSPQSGDPPPAWAERIFLESSRFYVAREPSRLNSGAPGFSAKGRDRDSSDSALVARACCLKVPLVWWLVRQIIVLRSGEARPRPGGGLGTGGVPLV